MTELGKMVDSLQGKIGQEIGVSEWVLINQAMIDKFADVTMDHQFIHVDPSRARDESPFGGTIAHGFLTL
ncbi:MaoC like domain-containing protein, partial [Shimia gijangensis]